MTSTAAQKRTTQTRTRVSKRESAPETLEKKIMGVPASIMRPRLILIAIVVFLVVFGLIMIYSASSVKALFEAPDYNAFSYVKRQLIATVLGLCVMALVIRIDYHTLCAFHVPIALGMCVLLAGVLAVGVEANGAKRWIVLFGIQFQPSEIAKATVLLTAAYLADKRILKQEMSVPLFWLELVVCVGLPLGLILVEPDNGTTAIIILMLLAILFDSGFHRKDFRRLVFAVVVIGLLIAFTVPYARDRVFTMFTAASDTQGDGYQINQGFIAFGSGGLFGKGIGMSHQKYSFLPEAHTDFIYAVIGEELGLFGTLLVLAAFFLLAHEVLLISRMAPDKEGRFICLGVITLIISQFFINVMGVLGMSPLTGKPLPFLSYGGSSIISCLILVGLVLNVSMRSKLPETEYDRRRARMELAEEDTGVGEAEPRSASRRGSVQLTSERERSRGTRSSASRGFSVVAGGAEQKDTAARGSGPYKRKDLGPSPAERLRSSSTDKSSNSSKRGRGESSRSSRQSKRS